MMQLLSKHFCLLQKAILWESNKKRQSVLKHPVTVCKGRGKLTRNRGACPLMSGYVLTGSSYLLQKKNQFKKL